MAILSPEAKNNAKPLINALWTALVVMVCIALASKYILSGYPPLIAFLEPFAELTIVLGVIGIGLIVADRNPLVK
ncbi:MAG: hypothetical protein CML03_00370 [Pseudooceanicola sp.]|jgi:hypothetical protein|nr:hypothetical protein [Pseudooceanicola sp.]|tara:strand:- start:13376 stop:13600 length:225 start_codon:yes stop_codon:yes gene_type:complete